MNHPSSVAPRRNVCPLAVAAVAAAVGKDTRTRQTHSVPVWGRAGAPVVHQMKATKDIRSVPSLANVSFATVLHDVRI